MTYTGTNYDQIEEALVRLGPTAEEADALTDILHGEGWGGEEDGEITDAILASKIEWFREKDENAEDLQDTRREEAV